MKKFAVILAGCGVYDGTEIHEAVLTLLAIDKSGNTYQAFAPDIIQHHVLNHDTKKPMVENRNVLTESARIVRGNILPLSGFDAKYFDALVIPGGFGVAKNLCTYAIDGTSFSINTEVEKAVLSMHNAGKPIGALCIAPIILSKLFNQPILTIGSDPTTEKHVLEIGAQHIKTTHGDVVVDEKNKLFTTPCYMLDASISQVALGAENLIQRMLKTF